MSLGERWDKSAPKLNVGWSLFEARGIDVVTVAGRAGLCRICARNDSRLSTNRHHSSGSTSLCLQPVEKRCKNKLGDSSDSGSRWRHDAGSGSGTDRGQRGVTPSMCGLTFRRQQCPQRPTGWRATTAASFLRLHGLH